MNLQTKDIPDNLIVEDIVELVIDQTTNKTLMKVIFKLLERYQYYQN